MRHFRIALLIASTIILFSCQDGEDFEARFATKSELGKSNNTLANIKQEIGSIKVMVDGKDEQLINLQTRIGEISAILERFSSDHEYIKELKNLDLAQISLLRAELDNLRSTRIEQVKKKSENKKKHSEIRRRRTLNVSLEHINTWGDRYVAVLHFPNNGYKTLSVNASVGNGWEIARIDKTSISLRHRSGIKRSLKL